MRYKRILQGIRVANADELGAESDLLGSVGGWRKTLPDEEVLDNLDCWIEDTIKERN